MNMFKQIQKTFVKQTSYNDMSHADTLALKRAYANFACRYPDWAAAYFDEHFLVRHKALVLKRTPPMSRASRALILATEWSRQFRWADQQKQRRLVGEATAVANDFLQVLEAEFDDQAVVLSPLMRGI